MEQVVSSESTPKRDEHGRLLPGQSLNPNGRPVETIEQKMIKKATKELIAEYKEGLTEALSKIQPVLIAKALEGDVAAIREVHDRTMDKAKQSSDITSGGLPIGGIDISIRRNE